MALFDTLIDDVASQFGLGSNAGPFVREILSMITGTPGGVGGFLNNMKAAGLSSEVASWMGQANAAPLAAGAVDRALGSTALSGIASRLGVAPALVTSAIGYALPKVIGLLTPGGVVPSSLPAEVANFVSAAPVGRAAAAPVGRVADAAYQTVRRVTMPFGAPAAQVAPRRIDVYHAPEAHDEPAMTGWLWPLLGALAILGLGLLFWPTGNRTVAPPVAQAPPAVAPTPPPPALAPPRLEIANDNGVAHVSGVVHDEGTKNDILNAIKAVFGADKVQGDIAVDLNRAAPPWLVNFRNGIEPLRTPGAQAVFDGNSVNVGGSVGEDDVTRITQSMRSVLGGSLIFGALSDRVADMVSSANNRAATALASLRSGFSPGDLTAALNQSVVNFPSGSADIPAAMNSFFQTAAGNLKQLPQGTVIEIAGYTDNTGDPQANVALSQKRAEAVRGALISAGVNQDMLVAKGYGSANPIASNDSAEGRFSNRRIEYRVVKTP
jgi:OmpA-OmpF porin, OOP family